MSNSNDIGKIGEDIACKFLERNNFKIIERNFECKQGEIDIIAIDKEELVFIEVKTRSNHKFGEGINAVDNYKQKHIYKSASYYIFKRNLEREFIRFDVIEIYIQNKITIKHLKNVEFKVWILHFKIYVIK